MMKVDLIKTSVLGLVLLGLSSVFQAQATVNSCDDLLNDPTYAGFKSLTETVIPDTPELANITYDAEDCADFKLTYLESLKIHGSSGTAYTETDLVQDVDACVASTNDSTLLEIQNLFSLCPVN